MDLGKLAELQHHRTCQQCGAGFETDEKQTALEKFADHSTEHNPSPRQWQEAHEKIQKAKEKKSGSSTGHSE